MDDDDEFGLSSGEEAVFAAACDVLNEPTKRKHLSGDDEIEPAAKTRSLVSYPTESSVATKILNQQFGLDQFRLEQEAVITRILQGGNAAVVFPTGGGKSLCYQIPALAFEELDKQSNIRSSESGGVTIVVSPLIALMKDQVDALLKRKIKAACLDSSKTRDQFLQIHDDMRAGKLRLLYCAPERLNNEGFIESVKSVRGGVRLVAVDEAHCISEWGHAFRPDYLKVARFVTEIKAERVVCLTATATHNVAQDICKAFEIDNAGLFKTTMYRPNLRLLARATETKQEKYPHLFSFLRKHPGSTIIYVTLQKQSEVLAEDLRKQGFNAEAFHAGMQTQVKTELQDKFMGQDNLIIVATIAFGMGIDKASIRNIIHFDIPSSVEGYSQQIGRAGRDGKPSICLFYLCPEDFYMQNIFTYGDLSSEQSLGQLMQDIFSPANLLLEVDDTFTVSQYSQSREFDIRPNALSIIYAQLELQFDLIRSTTPKYSSYSFETTSWQWIENDTTPAAMAIKRFSRKAVKLWHVDADAAGMEPGIVRADVVRKLNNWNESGIITLKASGVQHVYRVLRKLPSTQEAREEIAKKLYAKMQTREQQDLRRTKEVVNLVTSKRCISRGLATYFSDDSDDVPAECGHCTWCETHVQVLLPEKPPAPPDSRLIEAVLKACSVRDDPRFLARVAFGITSPRVTVMKLGKHPVFGSMNVCDFIELLRIFTAICDKSQPN